MGDYNWDVKVEGSEDLVRDFLGLEKKGSNVTVETDEFNLKIEDTEDLNDLHNIPGHKYYREYGPVERYEVVWNNGRKEVVLAHQCLLPQGSFGLSGGGRPNIDFHAEIWGNWGLVLSVNPKEVKYVRNLDRCPDPGEVVFEYRVVNY